MEFYISALVTLVVTAVIIVFLVRASKRYRGQNIKRNDENFVVRGGRTAVLNVCLALFVPMFFSLLFAFVQLLNDGADLDAGIWYFVISAVFLAVAVTLATDYTNHALTVRKEQLIYSDWRGRESRFSLLDIDEVVTGRGRLILFNADGKRLAVVDKSMICAYDLFDYLKRHGLTDRQTLDK